MEVTTLVTHWTTYVRPIGFLTPPELLDKLKEIVTAHKDRLPPELQKMASAEAQANYLLKTHCEFETAPGESVQWYAVRLKK